MSRLLTSRRLLRLLATAWVAVGLIGLYSYLDNYWVTRGFAAIRRDAGVRPGHLQWVDFYSPALARQADYLVYLPTGYDPAHRYPVFYLLHGSPGRPQAYINIVNINARLDNLIRSARVTPMILVFPDGRIDGNTFSDSEWTNTPAGRYEDYVLDVVRDVDRRFPTVPDRDARIIGGYSAGAFGALNVTLHHLAVFASFEAWSGPFAEARSGVFAHASGAQIAHYSPLDYTPSLAPVIARFPLQGFLYGGRLDEDSRALPRMATELQAAGAAIRWTFYPGGHDFQLWNAHVDQMLILASHYLLTPPPPARSHLPATLLRPARHHRRTTQPKPTRHTKTRARHPPTSHARKGQLSTTSTTTSGPMATTTAPAQRSATTTPPPHKRRHRSTRTPTSRTGTSTAPPPTITRAPIVPSTTALLVASQLAAGRNLTLTLGLILALGSAAAINLGFLLQQRGLHRDATSARSIWQLVRAAVRSPTWLAGQAIGWVGFAVQIAAVAIAPLSLVQAFAAGGLALSVPLAAAIFGHPVSRRQITAVVLTAAGLASLPVALSNAPDHLDTTTLLLCSAGALPAAVALGRGRAPALRAIAAGIFYGVADSTIKAVSAQWAPHPADALISGWTLLAIAGTFGGFLTFQASLRTGDAISAISLMNALATLVALLCGLLAFGESLGTAPAAVAGHALAVALVLACVPALAAAHTHMADEIDPRRARRPPAQERLALIAPRVRAREQAAAGGE